MRHLADWLVPEPKNKHTIYHPNFGIMLRFRIRHETARVFQIVKFNGKVTHTAKKYCDRPKIASGTRLSNFLQHSLKERKSFWHNASLQIHCDSPRTEAQNMAMTNPSNPSHRAMEETDTSTAAGTLVVKRNLQDLYKKSSLEVKLHFSVWNPNTSVAYLSSNNGENEVVDSVLSVIQDFLCLETDWQLAPSLEDVSNDLCDILRRSPAHRRYVRNRRGRDLDDGTLSSSEEETIIILQTPKLMIRDGGSKQSLEWTTWNLQYAVLEAVTSEEEVVDQTNESELAYFNQLTDLTQETLNTKIANGKIDDLLRDSLPFALTSETGFELETFANVIDYSPPRAAAQNFEPESQSLQILGVLMLTMTLTGALLLFRLSHDRRMAAEKKHIDEAFSVDSLMFDDEKPKKGKRLDKTKKLSSDASAAAAKTTKTVDQDALEVLGAEEGSVFDKDKVKMFDLPPAYRVPR
jgi:hypothetical protein